MVGSEQQLRRWILSIGIRAIERERNFFSRVRLAVKLLRAWGAYGNNRRIS